MGATENREHNMRNLNLTPQEYDEWSGLMAAKMNEWPAGLQCAMFFLRAKRVALPTCGEEIAETVGDWVRSKRERELPWNESTASFERWGIIRDGRADRQLYETYEGKLVIEVFEGVGLISRGRGEL